MSDIHSNFNACMFRNDCRKQADEIAALRADAIRTQNEVVMPLRERVKVLEDALRKACDDMEGWGLYAPEYFREKHDFVGDVEAARAALAARKGTT